MFITFEETKDSIFRTGKNFGWDLQKLEKEGKVAFIEYTPHEIEKMIKDGGGSLRDLVDSISAKRAVIDSLTAYSALFKEQHEINEGVLDLIKVLKSWDCTSIVIDEDSIDVHQVASTKLSFLTDGLIHIYNLRKDSGRFRAMEIIKMRRRKHSDKIVLFEIDDKGLEVRPESGIFGKRD